MITVSDAVATILNKSPLYEESITEGIANLSSLARIIRGEVEKLTYKKVTDAAILMALKRYKPKIQPTVHLKSVFTSSPDLTLKSNLVEFTIENSSELIQKYEKLLGKLGYASRHFFIITQGIFETTLIVSKELTADVEKIFKNEKMNRLDHISSITIKLPKQVVRIPGVYYLILRKLYWESINVIEVASTFSELTVFLKDQDVEKAFIALKEVLTT